MTVFNRALVRQHRQRHAMRRADFDFLVRDVADRLADRLDDVMRTFPLALELGCRGGVLASLLAARGGIKTLVQTDLSETMASESRAWGPSLVADEEVLPFANNAFDLVMSSLALHWVNDLPGALVQINHALKPDGLFLGAMFGGETLFELRDCLATAEMEVEGGLSPRVSPFADVRDLGSLMQRASFALPVIDSETITVSYAEPLTLMRDLRGMAESNAVLARRKTPLRRSVLMRACDLYVKKYGGDDGRIPATFQVMMLTGWAPAASQPQPLKPGQATTRLADVLNAEEGTFAEKAIPVTASIAPKPKPE